MSRSDLRDVHRRDHRSETDGETTNDAPQHEVPGREWEGLSEASDQEENRCNDHDLLAADLVCESSTKECTNRRAEQRDSYNESLK